MDIDIDKVALLARLDLTEEERETFSRQLGAILAFFQELQQIDTSDVPSTGHLFDQPMIYREDEPRACPSVEEMLRNAPAARDGFFVVPRVIRPGG